ncbi:hypothetical protein SSX86_010071 [Deinandra increscens subsp. villosa]|uniref:sucrose synthase n=1 Tax=Deinandra increscens subsp. villosa TaxID=3103831 RepID=A0AAP0H4M6_9ASTR
MFKSFRDNDENALEIDFGAMDFNLPSMNLSSSIGNGVNLTSKFITSKLHAKSGSQLQLLVEYLLSLNHQGEGWGDNAERVRETFGFLLEVLQAPDPTNLEAFFSRVPNIFNIVIFSIHGYFGQSNVLGLPDTGGQVVYVLDQVVALEEELLLRIKQQGLTFKPQIIVVTRLLPDAKGTKCNQDASAKIIEIMEGKPDLIIGNYTDGSLVASLMAKKLGTTLGTIAHALAKAKYEDSDLKWKQLEAKYHFSCQFTADMIAMNSADFIITSTYQEIAGRFDIQTQLHYLFVASIIDLDQRAGETHHRITRIVLDHGYYSLDNLTRLLV